MFSPLLLSMHRGRRERPTLCGHISTQEDLSLAFRAVPAPRDASHAAQDLHEILLILNLENDRGTGSVGYKGTILGNEAEDLMSCFIETLPKHVVVFSV